ncbi:TMEM175 family protein [Paludisphaera rhizosphaerae]|uniref:TMEM175 family protein n=1 Tax=Paludisphaera rhizosphaerae TaxID=2711216 RepID=UPI0013ED01C2|nr:TMEM175 family protein [Paludisphaera rhizosphaerae]
MGKGRLEAFSDGVIAILITIMVFDVKAPKGSDLPALLSVAPTLFTYSLSFVYLGIYWNNHHHMLQATDRIDGLVLWANLHLMFWLSLFPFATSWLAASEFAALPASLYGVVLFLAAIAYTLLQAAIIRAEGEGSRLKRAVGEDAKGKVSLLVYAVGVAISFVNPWLAIGCYAAVALIWLIPDRRIEALNDRVES